MTYYDVVNKAIENTIVTNEETVVSYLEPCYRDILRENDIHLPGHKEDGDDADKELWEILRLEVEKRNAIHNVSHALAEWAYMILTQTIDPSLLNEENDLMKNIIEYMQLNQEVKERQKELDEKEQEMKTKKVVPQVPVAGINFAKREI